MNYPNEVEKRFAILALAGFVKTIIEDGVRSTKAFNDWKKNQVNIDYMTTCFGYYGRKDLPSITSLVKSFFHPTLPLVGLNYTPVAHNTLHQFPEGWTTALRFCRGIVFDHQGDLVALPFMKFFNLGENPETKDLPRESFEVTAKEDGHLGIIFQYHNEFIITTRGSFTSPTAKLATQMLAEHAADNDWQRLFTPGMTLLVEVIHPQTKVFVDYGHTKEFIIIGAMINNMSGPYDFDHKDLFFLAQILSLKVTTIWQSSETTLSDLISLMKDRTILNKEGYVVRFKNGLRVKLKFENYIGLMVKDKLSPAYLMQRMIAGNLAKMIDTLPEEIYDISLMMLGKIMLAVSAPGTQAEKWRRLYKLPHTTSDSHFQSICRKFVKSFVKA